MRLFTIKAFLSFALAMPFAVWGQSAPGRPACGAPTPADTEGPYYRAGAPLRDSLAEPGAKAPRLVLTGVVRSADCRPLAGVILDFWQADANGSYDNRGYRYRGAVKTDAQGRYRLETSFPPPYAGRPSHIHVKLHRPGGGVLTTQLYFPGASQGENAALVVRMKSAEGVREASCDFVL